MRTLPEPLRSARTEPLRRVLRKLPDPILGALIEGLDSADVLVPGHLYEKGDGGCAVGVILRAIFPSETKRRGGWLSRRKHKTLHQTHPKLAKDYPYLATLEIVFDNTMFALQRIYPDLDQQGLSTIISRWIAAEAATELGFRELRALEMTPVEALRSPVERRALVANA